jgi:hypothetical protein
MRERAERIDATLQISNDDSTESGRGTVVKGRVAARTSPAPEGMGIR